MTSSGGVGGQGENGSSVMKAPEAGCGNPQSFCIRIIIFEMMIAITPRDRHGGIVPR